jgi:hypothetical protein
MKHIFLIVGLPGSGKTHLANEMLVRFPDSLLLDDMSRDTDDKIEAGNAHDHLIIADPNVCRFGPLRAIQKLKEWFGPHDLDIIAFENDPKQCWENVKNRRDGRKITAATIILLAKDYTADEWGKPRPVWRPNQKEIKS